jgi:hypothetical protein
MAIKGNGRTGPFLGTSCRGEISSGHCNPDFFSVYSPDEELKIHLTPEFEGIPKTSKNWGLVYRINLYRTTIL